MNWLPPRYRLPEGPPELDKRFMPDAFAPLFHHPAYALLDERQRLRYNQLYSLYYNEMAVFFEDAYAESVISAALRRGVGERLAGELRGFVEEERLHSDLFRRLNRLCAPQFYGAGEHFFVRVPAWAGPALAAANSRPDLFPFSVWVMLLMEDRSVYYSREVLRQEGVEPHFAALHRIHLADEMGHVRTDEALLELFWDRAPARLRRVNAWLLQKVVGQFFNAPVRGGPRLLRQLAREFPELSSRLPRLEAAMGELAADPAFHKTLFSREMTPRAFALFDRWPELRGMSEVMPGYIPL